MTKTTKNSKSLGKFIFTPFLGVIGVAKAVGPLVVPVVIIKLTIILLIGIAIFFCSYLC